MRLHLLAPAPVILITSVFALLAARTSIHAQADAIQSAEDRVLQQVSTTLDHVTETEAHRATGLAEVYAVDDRLQGDIRSQDRDALAADLQPTYDRLHASYGIEGLQVNVPPGVAMLRMHSPGKFGDDVTSRQMVMRALRGGEAQQGVEVGTSGAKIRGVVQVKAGEEVLGALEVHVGFSPVLESVKEISGFELAAFYREEGEPPADARMVGGYRELTTTNREAIAKVVDASALDGVQDVLPSLRDVDGERFGLVRIPMVDFEGRNIGVIVATRSFADFQKEESDGVRHAIVMAIVQIIAVSGATLLAFNGLVVRPMRRLAEKLEAGEGVDADLIARHDEVGDLARAVAKSKEAA